MRRILAVLCWCVVLGQPIFAQQTNTPPAQTPQAVDDSTRPAWITHRRAGQLQWLNPDNWEIRGCRTFTAEAIRRALDVDIDVTLATHPSAPADNLDTLPTLLRDKVIAGYQANGFPNPQVNVQRLADDKKIVIDIVEGQFCNRGPVEITGTQQLSKDRILAALVQPRRDESPSSDGSKKPRLPLWKAGEPANFSALGLATLRKEAQRILAGLGRPAAKFNLKLEPNGDTARLTLQILDEGPPLTVDRVQITGNERETAEQITSYLQLKPGMLWTRDEQRRVERLLSDSARFREFKVDYADANDAAKVVLSIKLVDLKCAPPLGTQFSPEEQALLKFGQWMSQFSSSNEDIVYSLTQRGVSSEVIFSPQHGGVVTVRAAGTHISGAPKPGRSVLFAIDTLGLYSEVRGHQWDGRTLFAGVVFNCNLQMPKDKDDESVSMVFGAGTVARDDKTEQLPSLRLAISASPAALISLAHRPNMKCTLAENVLTLDASESENPPPLAQIRIDATTGKLLESVTKTADGEERVALVAGAYVQRAKELSARWGQKPNDFIAKQPITSAIRFLLDEGRSPDLEKLELVPPLALNAIRKTIDQGLLEPIDQYIAGWTSRYGSKTFDIPIDFEARTVAMSDMGKMAFVAGMLRDDIVARDTWPWVLARETTAWLTGLDEFQQLELAEQLELPGNGPLCCLVTAELLLLSGQNDAAKQFALLGLSQLTADKFHDDVADLLDERGLLGRCLLKWADVLRQTDSITIAVVGFVLPEGPQQLLTNCYIELTKDLNRPIAQSLPEVLDRVWDSSVKSNLEKALTAVKDRAAGAPGQLATPDSSKTKVPKTARGASGSETKK